MRSWRAISDELRTRDVCHEESRQAEIEPTTLKRRECIRLHTRDWFQQSAARARASARGRRSIALDGLRVSGVSAHVDPLFPRSLERIAHVETHAPDPVDLEIHDLVILKGPEPLVIRAARDEVAGVERRDRRGEVDEVGDL